MRKRFKLWDLCSRNRPLLQDGWGGRDVRILPTRFWCLERRDPKFSNSPEFVGSIRVLDSLASFEKAATYCSATESDAALEPLWSKDCATTRSASALATAWQQERQLIINLETIGVHRWDIQADRSSLIYLSLNCFGFSHRLIDELDFLSFGGQNSCSFLALGDVDVRFSYSLWAISRRYWTSAKQWDLVFQGIVSRNICLIVSSSHAEEELR